MLIALPVFANVPTDTSREPPATLQWAAAPVVAVHATRLLPKHHHPVPPVAANSKAFATQYGRPSTAKERWRRVVWDVKHLANGDLNPFVIAGEGDLKPKNRTAIEDITHALKNLIAPNKTPKAVAPSPFAM